MAKLVSVATVRERINFESNADLDGVLDSILTNLTPDLETELRTTFAQATRTETWYVANSLSPAPGAFQTWLYLRQGAVTGLASVKSASTYGRLASEGESILDYAILAEGGETGVLLLVDVDLGGKYVQATYTAGFTESAGVFQNVPVWLQEMAILRAILKLDSTHPGVRFTDDDNPVSISRIKGLLQDTVAQHMRYEPRALKAL